MIDELATLQHDPAAAGGMETNIAVGLTNEVLQSLLVCVNRVEGAITKVGNSKQASISELWAYTGRNFAVVNNNIRWYGSTIERLLVRQRRSNKSHCLLNQNEADQATPTREVITAQLPALPCHYVVLWREYIFGLNGRKPARLFITAERNRNEIKQKYYRRNEIWECMTRLVRLGRTPEQAPDELYKIYGNKTPVTKMSDLIVKDRRRYGGYHPNLGLWLWLCASS